MADWITQALAQINLKKGVIFDTIIEADLPNEEQYAKIFEEGEEDFDDEDEMIFADEFSSISLF